LVSTRKKKLTTQPKRVEIYRLSCHQQDSCDSSYNLSYLLWPVIPPLRRICEELPPPVLNNPFLTCNKLTSEKKNYWTTHNFKRGNSFSWCAKNSQHLKRKEDALVIIFVAACSHAHSHEKLCSVDFGFELMCEPSCWFGCKRDRSYTSQVESVHYLSSWYTKGFS
jgi:hypothetical protein